MATKFVVPALFALSGCFGMMPSQQPVAPQPQAQAPATSQVQTAPQPASAPASPAPAETASPTSEAVAAEPPAPSPDLAPPKKTLPDLRTLIGESPDSPPPVFAKLKRGMTPDEVAAEFAGANKVSKFGQSSHKPKNIPGVAAYKFSFQDGKLYSSSIVFKTSLNSNAEFHDYLWKVTQAKYGIDKAGDDKILTYVKPHAEMIQVSKITEWEFRWSGPTE